jgi:hypothetical protein
MIAALAGRRVDAEETDSPRFPPGNVAVVRERIRAMLVERAVSALVCSAACGADLLGLDAAGELGIRRRVVLPFARDVFRRVSVADRPGDWGALYDRILDEVERQGDVVLLGDSPENPDCYEMANYKILDEALLLSRDREAMALVVWNGESRGAGDITEHFRHEAEVRHLAVFEIGTL